MKYTYLLIDIFTMIVPFVFSFHPKIKFNQYFKDFFIADAFVAAAFIIWDAIFTAKGVWGFSNLYTIGFRIFYLPIEEILFFVCIPFSCLFTIHSLNQFWKWKMNIKTVNAFSSIIIFVLFLIGIIFYKRLYTSITFISTALIIFLLLIFKKQHFLSNFYRNYIILLLPFLLVNGILTGTFLQEPIVWYNNYYNLGIRILTIPVEDIFYGFELILLINFFFEINKNSIKKKSKRIFRSNRLIFLLLL